MRITRKLMYPSREDAVRLRRTEKTSMFFLFEAATTLDNAQSDLAERLAMVENGQERLKKISQDVDALLEELRVTVPENQRSNLENTALDYEVRLVPKATQSVTNVIVEHEEFRTLVDSAREKCKQCADDDVSCQKCKLYKLLTQILPLDDYHCVLMCPYNLGEWKN